MKNILTESKVGKMLTSGANHNEGWVSLRGGRTALVLSLNERQRGYLAVSTLNPKAKTKHHGKSAKDLEIGLKNQF